MQRLGLCGILLLQGLPHLPLAKHIQAHAYAEHVQGVCVATKEGRLSPTVTGSLPLLR